MELEFIPSLMSSEHFHILNEYISHRNFELDINSICYTGVSYGDDVSLETIAQPDFYSVIFRLGI